jgi:flavin-dependent dehydrogenase
MISDNIPTSNRTPFRSRRESSIYGRPRKVRTTHGPAHVKILIDVDEHRQKVIRWLSSVDVSTNHYAACNKREPSSGDWFVRSPDFPRWKTDPGGFLWLYGFGES